MHCTLSFSLLFLHPVIQSRHVVHSRLLRRHNYEWESYAQNRNRPKNSSTEVVKRATKDEVKQSQVQWGTALHSTVFGQFPLDHHIIIALAEYIFFYVFLCTFFLTFSLSLSLKFRYEYSCNNKQMSKGREKEKEKKKFLWKFVHFREKKS